MLPPSLILRLARRLHAAWAGPAGEVPESGDAWRALDNRLALVGYARRRFGLARAAGLSLIVPQLQTEVATRLNAVFRQVEKIQSEYDRPHVRVLDLGEWLAEVRQLEAEFDDVEVRWSDTANQDRGTGVKNRILDLFHRLADDATEAASGPAIEILTAQFREVEKEILAVFEQHTDPLSSAADAIVASHELRVKRSDAQRRKKVLADAEAVLDACPRPLPAETAPSGGDQ